MESPKKGCDLGTCVTRGKTLAFEKRIAIISCVLEASLGARACVQAFCVEKKSGFLRLRSQAFLSEQFLSGS